MPEYLDQQQLFFKLLNFRSGAHWTRAFIFLISFLKYSTIVFVLALCWCLCFFLFTEDMHFISEKLNLSPSNFPGSALANYFWGWLSFHGWGPSPQTTTALLLPTLCFAFLLLRLLEQSACNYAAEHQISNIRKFFYQNEFLKLKLPILNRKDKMNDLEILLMKTGELLLLYKSKIQPTIVAIILFTLAGLATNTALFLIFSGTFLFIIAIQSVFAKKINAWILQEKNLARHESKNFASASKSISFSKALGLSHIWLEKLSHSTQDLLKARLKISFLNSLKQHLGYISFTLCLIIFLIQSGGLLSFEISTPPNLFTSGVLAFFAAFYTNFLLECELILKENLPTTTELFNRLENKNELTRQFEGWLDFPTFKTIHLDSICIKNTQDVLLFNNLTLSIEKNTKVGFAGLDKDQKIALGMLLSCALTPDSGEIRFDNTNARNLNNNLLPREITFVSDCFEPMPDSVQNIICNYSQNPDFPRMLEATKNTNIHTNLAGNPKKYELLYNPEENMFDGTFKFLLGLARSIYLNARVLVLEEPSTQELKQNQDRISSVYEKTLAGKTIIFLGGSENTFSICDKIYLFRDKEILAVGNHKTLSNDYPGYHLTQINNLSK